MNILVNFFHPQLEKSRINFAWLEALSRVKNVTVNHAYAQYDDWQINVEREKQRLIHHDLIVFQFPFLWYSMPPLMKKWFDDVLTYGWAYGNQGNALKGKSALLAISTGCAQETYQAGGDNLYSMTELLRPIQQTIELTQMNYLPPFIFHGAGSAHQSDIQQSAQDYIQTLKNISQPITNQVK